MAVEWRDSVDRFVADLWDMTPGWGSSGRFLGMKDTDLGFSRDNVEWHFPRIRKPGKVKAAKVKAQVRKRRPPKEMTAAKKRADLQAAKQARREALAAEFLRWEQKKAG